MKMTLIFLLCLVSIDAFADYHSEAERVKEAYFQQLQSIGTPAYRREAARVKEAYFQQLEQLSDHFYPAGGEGTTQSELYWKHIKQSWKYPAGVWHAVRWRGQTYQCELSLEFQNWFHCYP